MFLPSDIRIHAFLVAMFAGLGHSLSAAYSTDGSDGDIDLGVTKRGWNMLRLGRGLQMLRLGKRNGYDLGFENEAIPWDRLSEEELHALISASNEPRSQSRRQPPLPRYGRQVSSTARDLLNILAGDSSMDTGSDTVVFRHPPRGGRRYKRSVGSPVQSDDGYIYGANSWTGRPYRAVALPRYGRQYNPVSWPQAVYAVPTLARVNRDSNNAKAQSKADSSESTTSN